MRKLLQRDYYSIDPRFSQRTLSELARAQRESSKFRRPESEPEEPSGCEWVYIADVKRRVPRAKAGEYLLQVAAYRENRQHCLTGQRSGLASAAGFAGLAYLFRYSFDALVFLLPGLSASTAAWLVFMWCLSAPLAVVLGFMAARRIDRAPASVGRVPALIGFAIGVGGTVELLTGIDRWLFLLS